MKSISNNQFDFKRVGWAVIAIAAVITIGGASSSSHAQFGDASAMSQAVAAGSPTSSDTEVKIDNFVFAPGTLTVKAGTQVTWINKDDIPHTVDSTEGKFKSAALDTDDKFQFRFTEPGEYPFYCRMHPKMTGKIIVLQ